jgi:hypothetical protein
MSPDAVEETPWRLTNSQDWSHIIVQPHQRQLARALELAATRFQIMNINGSRVSIRNIYDTDLRRLTRRGLLRQARRKKQFLRYRCVTLVSHSVDKSYL